MQADVSEQPNPYYFPDASDRDGGPIHNIAIVLLRLIKAIK